MSDIQVITATKNGTKIGEFNIKNSFLEQKVSPYMPIKKNNEHSKIASLLKHMSVPFGLVYLQTYGSNRNQNPLEEFKNMNIDNVASNLKKVRAFNNHNSCINNNNDDNNGNNNNNEHVRDTKVMEQPLCDRLLGVMKAYEKEKKEKDEKENKNKENKNKENKNKENKKATRKIHHNENNKNNKHKGNKNNKNTRKNNKK